MVVAAYDCGLALEAILSAKKQNKLRLFHSIITHIYDNHIQFEVSLHFWWIWPSVRRGELIRRQRHELIRRQLGELRRRRAGLKPAARREQGPLLSAFFKI